MDFVELEGFSLHKTREMVPIQQYVSIAVLKDDADAELGAVDFVFAGAAG